MTKVLVICGPTGVGKSDFGRYLAKQYKGEIINGDSMQVYKEMNIGTAKDSLKDREEIPHHLFDIKTIKESFSVAEFKKLLSKSIKEVADRGHLPIIVGGTGLYLKAGLYDYEFKDKGNEKHNLESKTTEELYALLEMVDPETSQEIHPNNRKRIIRAIELFYETGIGKSGLNKIQEHKPVYDVLFIGLTRPREELYKAIDERVDKMMVAGLEQEARYVLENADKSSTALQAIGYKEFLNCYDNEEIKSRIKLNTRRFAKRQYTWFNNQLPVYWVDVQGKDKDDILKDIKERLEGWLNG